MAGFTLTEYIRAAPNKVFDFLLDMGQAQKVISSIKKTESLDKGPVKIGTRFRQARLYGGKEIEAEFEVLAYEPRKRFTVYSERNGIRAIYGYTLRPDAGGTILQLQCEVEGEGIRRPLAWIVAEAMRREDGGILQKMRRTIENSDNETATSRA